MDKSTEATPQDMPDPSERTTDGVDTEASDPVSATAARRPLADGPRASSATSLSGMPRRPAHAAITNPKADIEALNNLEHHLYAHRYARIGLECYGPSIDPSAATSDRGEALAVLEEEDQALLCSPETGALLDRLSGLGHLLSEMQELQIKVLQRDREQHLGVPVELQAKIGRAHV